MDHRYRKFLAVVETGSFSAAAKQLHVSQPAITLAIASLEHALGAKLYVRGKHSIEVTPAGEVVATSARKIQQESDKLHAKLTAHANAKIYQVGLIDSIAHLLYSTPKENSPLADTEVMVDNSNRIINDLLGSKIDMGIITGQFKVPSRQLTISKLHGEEFVFVRKPGNMNASVTHIDDWLAFNQESTSFAHFNQLFKKLGMDVTPVFYSTSMELLKDMAIAGKGTALLPRHLVQPAVADGSLIIINTVPLYRPIWAVRRRGERPKAFTVLAGKLNNLLST